MVRSRKAAGARREYSQSVRLFPDSFAYPWASQEMLQNLMPRSEAIEESMNQPDSATTAPRFVFVACQPTAQNACKKELAVTHPELKPAFSRPGFLTFKTTAKLADRFSLRSTFARSFGWTLENHDDVKSLVDSLTKLLAEQDAIGHLHVWNRDWTDNVKYRDEESEAAVVKLSDQLRKTFAKTKVNSIAEADSKVIDIIKVDDRWMVGWHLAGTINQRWPGGIPLLDRSADKISRAYFKASESILWSGANISAGDTVAEVGSAPGGCCQKLLELGANVIAIDPADMDPKILTHKRLTHLRMRGREVQHRLLADVSWLFVDSSVAPKHTLDTVEAMSSGDKTRFRGMILTLKCMNQEMFDEIPNYVNRVKSWGFKFVKTRHLAFGRQEICLVAMKQKAVRRFRG